MTVKEKLCVLINSSCPISHQIDTFELADFLKIYVVKDMFKDSYMSQFINNSGIKIGKPNINFDTDLIKHSYNAIGILQFAVLATLYNWYELFQKAYYEIKLETGNCEIPADESLTKEELKTVVKLILEQIDFNNPEVEKNYNTYIKPYQQINTEYIVYADIPSVFMVWLVNKQTNANKLIRVRGTFNLIDYPIEKFMSIANSETGEVLNGEDVLVSNIRSKDKSNSQLWCDVIEDFRE